MFKEALLDRFFFIEWTEKNMVIHEPPTGGMSVQEYSLKFTLLCKYSPTMVANPRSWMNKFVMGVSILVEK